MCGEKLPDQRFAMESALLCNICRRAAPRFRKAIAYGAYQGALRDLLHLFKYQRIRPAAPVLGRLLGEKIAAAGPPQDSLLVIPVPLAPGKRRVRGFNQAEEIARAWLRAHPAAGIQLDAASLTRSRETVSQTGLTRHQRQANLRGAFAVIRPENVQEKKILLVDDVMTTGATANECARVLLKAGAAQVLVATVARATRELEQVPAGPGWGGVSGHA